MILKKNFIILLKVRLDNWKKKNVLCMFASLLSLAHSHVVHSLTALINSSRLALALCVCVCICVHTCLRVCTCCTFSTEGPGGYAGATGPPRHLTAPLPHSPPYPSGLLLLAWLAALHQADTHRHRLCPPTNPCQNTHTTRFTTPHSGPIDTALRLSSDQSFGGAVLPEENPIQHSLLRVAYSLCV